MEHPVEWLLGEEKGGTEKRQQKETASLGIASVKLG